MECRGVLLTDSAKLIGQRSVCLCKEMSLPLHAWIVNFICSHLHA